MGIMAGSLHPHAATLYLPTDTAAEYHTASGVSSKSLVATTTVRDCPATLTVRLTPAGKETGRRSE